MAADGRGAAAAAAAGLAEVVIGGGGARNPTLLARLKHHLDLRWRAAGLAEGPRCGMCDGLWSDGWCPDRLSHCDRTASCMWLRAQAGYA